MFIEFLLFKSKEFISLYSDSKLKRYLSQLQTTINTDNDYIEYSIHGKRHREEKELNCILPAIVYKESSWTKNKKPTRKWYKNGLLHRDDRERGDSSNQDGRENGKVLPAIIYTTEDKEWYKNGKRHRDDLDEKGRVLPANIWNNQKSWYKNGKQHRDDRDENGRVLPARIKSNGTQSWYKNGELHRDDRDEKGRVLPAIINSDGSQWYENGKRHRNDKDENGRLLPAIIWGGGIRDWYVNGLLYKNKWN